MSYRLISFSISGFFLSINLLCNINSILYNSYNINIIVGVLSIKKCISLDIGNIITNIDNPYTNKK